MALTSDSALGGIGPWGFIYMLYVQGLLTLLVPLAVWLIEPDRQRRLMVWPFLLIGAALTIYMLWALISFHTAISLEGHSVVYTNPGSSHLWIAALKVDPPVPCGSRGWP